MNATKHGLAGQSASIEARLSPEFLDRRAKWEAEFQPANETADWTLDRAVAASFRIEKCGQALDTLAAAEAERARLAWSQDREVEAATILGRLARNPVLAARQLETTLAGVRLLLDAWFGLAEAFDAGQDWSDAEASKALDLLGVAPECRSGRTRIQPPEGVDRIEFRKALVLREVDRLEAVRDEVMTPLDELNREIAMAGDLDLLSKPARLILRYERDAWKRYHESIAELKAQAHAPAVAAPPAVAARPPSPVASPPRVVERNEANSDAVFLAERRALLADAACLLSKYPPQPLPMNLDDDSDWLGRPGPTAARPIPGSFVPIAAGVRTAIG